MGLPAKQPEEECENGADEQARHDGEMEAEIVSGDMNIAGQPPNPPLAHTGPEQDSDSSDDQSYDDQKLSELVHLSISGSARHLTPSVQNDYSTSASFSKLSSMNVVP